MVYGYLRVSSDQQDVNSQKQGVDKFADDHGWKINKYISDEGVSGGKDPDKRKLGPLLKALKKDDIVICSEISRLGRDLYMVMDILHFCMERGCIIYTVKDRFVLGEDLQSKVLAFAFGLAAEIERQMIRQRTKEGIALKRKLGVLMGRPCGRKTTVYKLDKYNEELPLCCQYEGHEDEYPKYDNYDAIEVNQIRRIPRDYWGIMGVFGPTFFARFNKEQFEIVGCSLFDCKPIKSCIPKTDTYAQGGLACYLTENKTHHKRLNSRIFIRRKK